MHKFGEHGHIARTLSGQRLLEAGVENLADVAVCQQSLHPKKRKPILLHQHLFAQSAHALPSRVAHPYFFGLGQRLAAVAVEQQADARQVLRHAHPVHAGIKAGLRDGGAVAVGRARHMVQIGGLLHMPQRQQAEHHRFARFFADKAGQIALFKKSIVVFGRILHAGAVLHISAVIKLARVAQGIPIGHFQRGVVLVVQLFLRLPQRPIVKIGGGLRIISGFLIAGGRLFTETARNIGIGVAHRRDGGGFDFQSHTKLLQDGFQTACCS